MGHITQTKILQFIKPLPCAVCGSADNVHEYITTDNSSFFSCDTCNVSADAGKTSDEAVKNWDSIMRTYDKLTKEQYYDALDSGYLGDGHYDNL